MPVNKGRRKGKSRTENNVSVKKETKPKPSLLPQKRKLNGTQGGAKSQQSHQNKKVRFENELSQEQNRLAEIIAEFNITLSELFQLKEYKSLVFWEPKEFLASLHSNSVPEIIEYFLNNTGYKLSWMKDAKDLSDIPLRLQKKALQDQETKIKEKYPFRDEVMNRSREIELDLLLNIEVAPEPEKPLSKRKQVSVKSEPAAITPNIKSDDSLHEDYDVINQNLKINRVKFSINAPIITHPSHIPSWRSEQNDSIKASKDEKITDYMPKSLEVIASKDNTEIVPNVGNQIRNFLETRYKSPIIDETSTTDYKFTLEEYEKVMDQQINLFKKLNEKIYLKKSLELNGDKIEKRKTVLPHSSNSKQQVDLFRQYSYLKPQLAGVQSSSTYLDNFLHQAVIFSKTHQNVRKNHQLRARKIAQMIEQHFKKKRGEKERLARDREQNLKRLSKIAVLAVKKRWTQALKVYRYLQQEKEDELRKIKGREHLSQMLEHSTQLLEAQLNQKSKDDNNSDTGDDYSITPLPEDSGLKSHDSASSASNESGTDELSGTENSDSEAGTLSALYDGTAIEQDKLDVKSYMDYSEKEKAIIEESSKNVPDSLLDLDSSSDELDLDDDSDEDNEQSIDDMDEEINENSQSEDTSNVKNSANGEGSTLSLLRNDNIDDESDDGSVKFNSSEDSIESDNMSSSDNEMEDEPKTPRSSESSDRMGDRKNSSNIELEDEVNGSKVRDVPVPSLLRGTLRPYQKQGLNWLASLYNNNTNGILADEMGLGKTIQTISLLAYLACEHGIWGPHLIIVPTSVMLNWEMEFKKFAPGFKVLTYYGSPQQRAQKRKGWNKPDTFHVCITSYQLVVHDHQSFKRRKWRYMILDEAHNIKNFRSARWRALLNFNTENRLLLTGTPLQNNLIELWSLLYFLMPSSKVNQAMPDGFANLDDFQNWFGRPVDRILEQSTSGGNAELSNLGDTAMDNMDEETKNTVARLHQVLRPYLLRRLKRDVETQMPAKYEHVVYCRLSKRQRFLYDEFMSRAQTKETLASGNFLSIINCLMQLRKVCNHPDLFEVRPILTSFVIPRSISGRVKDSLGFLQNRLLVDDKRNHVSFSNLNLDVTNHDLLEYFVSASINALQSTAEIESQIAKLDKLIALSEEYKSSNSDNVLNYYRSMKLKRQIDTREKFIHLLYLNKLRCGRMPLMGGKLISFLKCLKKITYTSVYDEAVNSIAQKAANADSMIEKFSVITPSVVALDMVDQLVPISTQKLIRSEVFQGKIENPFHKSQVKLSIAFPDKSLLQYDCGKLQKLAQLMQQLTSEGHRALIFTQMTKVLDILEQFLNIHGYRYMRLDGATKIEDRQLLTEKFNRDPKIPVFILSTRSGGLGINLTGADTVIFYDSDWNPAMDKQCQDRCHRIGQSRDVHIYRFVSEYTIESNILRKANQKRQLDNVVIQEGEFTTDYFGKFSVKDLVNDVSGGNEAVKENIESSDTGNMESVLAQVEDEDDRAAAQEAMKEAAIDEEDFDDTNKPGSLSATPAAPDNQTPNAEPTGSKGDDLDYEDGVGHIDEYMLRFIANGYYWD